MTFYNKSYGECIKIEKPTYVQVTDEGSNDDEDDPVSVNIDNYNIFSNDSDSDDEVKENFFKHEFDEELK